MKLLSIAIFGVAGVLTRHFIDSKFSDSSTTVPLTTFWINVLGCMFAGSLAYFLLNRGATVLTTGLLVGFCGGLTTFSGYTLQTLNLQQNGQFLKAFAYVTLSPIAGLIFAYLSFHLTAFLTSQQ